MIAAELYQQLQEVLLASYMRTRGAYRIKIDNLMHVRWAEQ